MDDTGDPENAREDDVEQQVPADARSDESDGGREQERQQDHQHDERPVRHLAALIFSIL